MKEILADSNSQWSPSSTQTSVDLSPMIGIGYTQGSVEVGVFKIRIQMIQILFITFSICTLYTKWS